MPETNAPHEMVYKRGEYDVHTCLNHLGFKCADCGKMVILRYVDEVPLFELNYLIDEALHNLASVPCTKENINVEVECDNCYTYRTDLLSWARWCERDNSDNVCSITRGNGTRYVVPREFRSARSIARRMAESRAARDYGLFINSITGTPINWEGESFGDVVR